MGRCLICYRNLVDRSLRPEVRLYIMRMCAAVRLENKKRSGEGVA